MENRIGAFKDHFIIAGYTDVSRQVIRMLKRRRIPFVVLDDNLERIRQAEDDLISEILPINPFLNDSFRRAGADCARGLIVSFPDDADNITVVVTGKIMEDEFNRRMLIISVASHKEARSKLLKVGADVVILANELIGQRISAVALHPPDQEQSSFLDRVAFGEFHNLDIREVLVGTGSTLDGVTIMESRIRNEIGAHILGIHKRGKRKLKLMPDPKTMIRAGDHVLVMGTTGQLKGLPEFLHPSQHVDEDEGDLVDDLIDIVTQGKETDNTTGGNST
ncbi:MAG: TrkA family potassium uptake protein [Magnetococcales bacterium]|nr:TrkA family potassium uptake protein [Magnetococcales bacterium]